MENHAPEAVLNGHRHLPCRTERSPQPGKRHSACLPAGFFGADFLFKHFHPHASAGTLKAAFHTVLILRNRGTGQPCAHLPVNNIFSLAVCNQDIPIHIQNPGLDLLDPPVCFQRRKVTALQHLQLLFFGHLGRRTQNRRTAPDPHGCQVDRQSTLSLPQSLRYPLGQKQKPCSGQVGRGAVNRTGSGHHPDSRPRIHRVGNLLQPFVHHVKAGCRTALGKDLGIVRSGGKGLAQNLFTKTFFDHSSSPLHYKEQCFQTVLILCRPHTA